jgi:ABC-type phosphate transport system permease subunit
MLQKAQKWNKIADTLFTLSVRFCSILVIIAVFGMMFFLFKTVVPLFYSAEINFVGKQNINLSSNNATPPKTFNNYYSELLKTLQSSEIQLIETALTQHKILAESTPENIQSPQYSEHNSTNLLIQTKLNTFSYFQIENTENQITGEKTIEIKESEIKNIIPQGKIEHFVNTSTPGIFFAVYSHASHSNSLLKQTCGIVDVLQNTQSSVWLWTNDCNNLFGENIPRDAILVSHKNKRLLAILSQQKLNVINISTGTLLGTFDNLNYPTISKNILTKSKNFSIEFYEEKNSTENSFIHAYINDEKYTWKFFSPHDESSFKSYFQKIHYEGYSKPDYVWQSTSGTENFQSKYSLVPLIWGTLKATLYSLLFAVPLALFAAIYSSEYLDRNTRNFIKPTIEMMASLPSVVLGFLAAIILAPWIESHILSVLMVVLSMPFLLFLFGQIWLTISAQEASAKGLYASRKMLFYVITAFLLAFIGMFYIGVFLEKLAFAGDVKNFFTSGEGFGALFWGILFCPLFFILLLTTSKGRHFKILTFIFAPCISIFCGYIFQKFSQSFGINFSVGAYSQRNTLVIAVAMGFAIIPIIYSLAEDALTSVPNTLRAASLACGASVWQTTHRVVLPTAASGLFSALMVGLGRGVGETMVVVMATGNTALMSANPFEGLRSLAANIAVELPEAAQGSTHYRTLFLSALVLFLFTFVLNTCSEVIRKKFRERNKAL